MKSDDVTLTLPPGVIAASPAMRAVFDWAQRIGPTGLSVLLTGETGTGKEVVARVLHSTSPRRAGPFVAVNCAAIPDALVESELFGHQRGAFTDAVADQPGLLELADRGTLFLDEVGEMPHRMQAVLLRVLEDGEMRRVGASSVRRVDVRVLAATNRDVHRQAERGTFHADLYFRLSGARCHVPPLRERREDVDALVAHWLPETAAKAGRPNLRLADGALAVLGAHPWPGNVRELRHVIEYAVHLADGDEVSAAEIAAALSRGQALPDRASPGACSAADQRRTVTVLEETRWNRTLAAKQLGIDRKTLWRRLRRLGLGPRPSDRS